MKAKKILASVLALSIACAGLVAFGGCDDEPDTPVNGGTVDSGQLNIIDDNNRNYYEIFVRSFWDSGEDGIGDLKGVTHQLDYLSKEDMAILADACRHDKFTTVSFHDGATGQLISMTARAEGLTYMPHYDWAKSKIMWKSVTVSFKEK